jgi:crotonobetainyl-CoA:carnitine CoA-transferase CaiB-like acyl-CoA transferase
MSLPLQGFTIVAIEQAVAAPLATRNLAALGARVIKVERIDGGDFARGYDHVVHGTGAHFVWLNRGKESIAVDLKSVEGRSIVRRLIDSADVFVQNLAPGAADRLGLGADELLAAARTRHGRDIGIRGGRPVRAAQGLRHADPGGGGLISITGTADQPAKTGIPTADIASGMYAAQAVLAALLRRSRTGEGATIDVSMLDATVEWMGHALYTQMYTGTPPPRMGLSHTSIAPYDAYPTSDGQMLIGVQNAWGLSASDPQVLDAPELADDPRLATNVDRVQNRSLCDTLVGAQTRRWSTAELDARLAAAGIPAAQVKGLDQVVDHPQLRDRNRWRTIGTENAAVSALLPPATFSDTDLAMGDVPALGQHTLRLLLESGMDATAANDALTRGIARQSDTVELAPAH